MWAKGRDYRVMGLQVDCGRAVGGRTGQEEEGGGGGRGTGEGEFVGKEGSEGDEMGTGSFVWVVGGEGRWN